MDRQKMRNEAARLLRQMRRWHLPRLYTMGVIRAFHALAETPHDYNQFYHLYCLVGQTGKEKQL